MPPFGSLSAFTKQQFLDFDGRSPTSTELSAANTVLSSGAGGATPATQVEAATAFGYWGPNVDPITRLYYAFFQRPPDRSGLNHWSVMRRSGDRLAGVANFFAVSSEFQHTYGTLSNRQFVDLVYQNVLGRSGDSGGVTHWTAQLDEGKQSRGQVMIGFSESHEHKTRRAGEVNTVDVFFGMLRRVPTAAELATWAPVSTTSKLFVITSVLGMPAYDARRVNFGADRSPTGSPQKFWEVLSAQRPTTPPRRSGVVRDWRRGGGSGLGFGGFAEGADRLAEAVGDVPHVGDRVPIGDHAEVHRAHVRQHRDVEPGALEERAERVDADHAGAGAVERDGRARDVGDDEVVHGRVAVGEVEARVEPRSRG